jgi:tetratricopeptide (TPR) repeat protein
MTRTEIDRELRGMGVDPHRLPPLSLGRVLATRSIGYAYVSDGSMRDESLTDEVRLLVIEFKLLTRQRHYAEALELARRATLLAPRYWRAWISYGSLLCLTGDLDAGEAVFRRVRQEFSADPKAAAAALHCYAFAKEDRDKLNPSEKALREVSRLYEEALELDESRVNTRACLVISSLASRQLNKGRKIFEDSLLCEGFLDSMSLEIKERKARVSGAKMERVVRALPSRYRNFLAVAAPRHAGSRSAGLAY